MMTVTEGRGVQGDIDFPSAPAGILRGATVVALLALSASLLPGVPAAQAQTPGSTRLELATIAVPVGQDTGKVYLKWSDDNGAHWTPWSSLGEVRQWVGAPALISDGYGRLNVFAQAFVPADLFGSLDI